MAHNSHSHFRKSDECVFVCVCVWLRFVCLRAYSIYEYVHRTDAGATCIQTHTCGLSSVAHTFARSCNHRRRRWECSVFMLRMCGSAVCCAVVVFIRYIGAVAVCIDSQLSIFPHSCVQACARAKTKLYKTGTNAHTYSNTCAHVHVHIRQIDAARALHNEL